MYVHIYLYMQICICNLNWIFQGKRLARHGMKSEQNKIIRYIKDMMN